MTVQNYRELIARQKAMELVRVVYDVSRKFPSDEIFGLSSQIRRSAVSFPSNIAEGQGRNSTKDFLRHLSISHGSHRKVETQNLIAEMQGYISADESLTVMASRSEFGKLINGLANSLRKRL